MRPFSVNIRGQLHTFSQPQVMGILNVTPDSFYDGSRTPRSLPDAVARRAEKLLEEGADLIDIGGYSTRPGADDVSPDEELRRLQTGLEAVRKLSADIPVSVDTFRASVAREAVGSLDADIINDVSGGLIDSGIYRVAAELHAPYILMHMRGTPSNMQQHTDYSSYGGVTAGVAAELKQAISKLNLEGVADIIIDPGFGFSKTAAQNYELMRELPQLAMLLDELPMLVGISRKSMIYKSLGTTPARALPGTTALNTLALERGAAILRVHDVAEAVQVRDVMQLFGSPSLCDKKPTKHD